MCLARVHRSPAPGGGRMAQLIGAYLGAAARACEPVPRVIRIAAADVREEEKD